MDFIIIIIIIIILWTEEANSNGYKKAVQKETKMAASRISVHNISGFPSQCINTLQVAEET